MNIDDYEAIAADPALVEKIRFGTFYAMGRSKDPRFVARWAEVPEAEKAAAGFVGLEALRSLVDDYTTPGCMCKYCTWKGESTHGRLIMCTQRWDRLSPEERRTIGESCAD
jgi:hypothetical protein